MNNTNVNDYEVDGFRKHLIKTYAWMFLGILITFVTAYAVATVPILTYTIFFSNMMPFILLVAQLGVVVAFSARLMQMKVTTARILFIAYSVLTGVTFSGLFIIYEIDTLIYAFAMAATYFGSLVVIGLTTRFNLSGIGAIGFAGLIAMLIFQFITLFIPMPQFNFVTSLIGLIVFAGITAWDAQKIKLMYDSALNGDEHVLNRLSIYSAFELYLDFINIFLYILRILGRRND